MLSLNAATTLNHAENSFFVGEARTRAFITTTDIGFIRFNHARERAVATVHHECTDLLGNAPCRFIRYAEVALNFFRRYTVLGYREEVDDIEPVTE